MFSLTTPNQKKLTINLLAWREQARILQCKKFLVSLAISLLLLLNIIIFAHFILSYLYNYEQSRTVLLTQRITVIDKQLIIMKNIVKQKQIILSKIAVINTLMNQRVQFINLLIELAHIVPQDVLLTGIQREGDEVKLIGKTDVNSSIAVMMRAIEASKELQQSSLKEIKNNHQGKEFNNNNFVISFHWKA